MTSPGASVPGPGPRSPGSPRVPCLHLRLALALLWPPWLCFDFSFALLCLAAHLHCFALPCVLALRCFAVLCVALFCHALHCLALPCFAFLCFATPCFDAVYCLYCCVLLGIALRCIVWVSLALPCCVLLGIALRCFALLCLAIHLIFLCACCGVSLFWPCYGLSLLPNEAFS